MSLHTCIDSKVTFNNSLHHICTLLASMDISGALGCYQNLILTLFKSQLILKSSLVKFFSTKPRQAEPCRVKYMAKDIPKITNEKFKWFAWFLGKYKGPKWTLKVTPDSAHSEYSEMKSQWLTDYPEVRSGIVLTILSYSSVFLAL